MIFQFHKYQKRDDSLKRIVNKQIFNEKPMQIKLSLIKGQII
jgi:hypothetical protein